MNEGNHIYRYQSMFFALVLLFSSAVLLVPSLVKASTIIAPNTTITTSTIWTVSGSPYILASSGQLNVMGELTIEPGVIVKGTQFSGIFVHGNIHIRGTEAERVVFTSYFDDSVGGNTSGGSASSPQGGDWGGIHFDRSSSSSISYATFLYGGLFYGRDPITFITILNHSVLMLESATVALDHVTIDQSINTGIYINGTSTLSMDHSVISHTIGAIDAHNTLPLELHNNSFVSNTSYALYAAGRGHINATRNWWGDDSGPAPAGRGGRVVLASGQIIPSVTYDPWIGVRDPVILIPGILGSELKTDEYTTIWPNPVLTLIDPFSSFMNVLEMNEDGSSANAGVRAGNIIMNVGFTQNVSLHFFDQLKNDFLVNHYVENTDLLYFPYDWRLGIKENSEKLGEFIAAHTSGPSKVDIVAHSMGGLLVKQYLIDHPNTPKVDTIVFVGTPHLGAPKAAKILMFGDDMGTFGLINQNEIKKISKNMSSVYELLPSNNYISMFGGYLYDSMSPIPTLDYNSSTDFLTNYGLNTSLLTKANNFHTNALDTLSFPSSMNTFNISGCQEPTISTIARRYYQPSTIGHGHYEYYAAYAAGDGTVPLVSSDAPNLLLGNRFYVTRTNHSTMPSQEGIRELIVDLILHPQAKPTLPGTIIQNKNTCHLNGQIVSTHSPINIQVYDDAGNHTGPNTDGTVDLSIPGVSYDNLDDNKFVFLPNNPNVHYRIELEATATGTFNMRVGDVTNDQPTQTTYYNAVPIITASRGQVQLSINPITNHTVVDLELDHTGTNNFETIPITSVLDATTTFDFTKPTTTVELFDSITSSTLATWTSAPVTVTLTAIDDLSGVLRTEYSLDSGSSWQTYSVPFTISEEGITLLYRSIDLAGNMEEAKSTAIPIDLTAPEVGIRFDTSTFDYDIFGVDSLASTTVSTISTNTIRLTDEAGNTTEVQLSTTSSTNNTGYFTRTIQVTSIRKNGVTPQVPIRNQILTQWQLSPTGTLRWVQETLQTKNGLYIIARYDVQTNETIISQKLSNQTRDEIGRASGEHLPMLQTNDLSFIYY